MAQRQRPTFNYGRSPKIYLPTPRPVKKVQFPWRGIWITLAIIVVIGIGYLLLLSPYFLIKNVEVKGTLNPTIIEQAQDAKWKNLWLYKSGDLKTNLQKFPEISHISIRKWPPATLKINITEKTEGIIWQTQGKKYLLDSKGLVIKEVTESSLPVVVDPRNIDMEPGKQVVGVSFVNFVKNLTLKFTPKTNLPLNQIAITEETTFEIIVQTQWFKVIFDTQGNLDEQLDNMMRVYQAKKDEIKEYMDLRIPGRVYYK